MASFSPSEAAFEGFRLTREKPTAMTVWSGFNLVANTVVAWLFAGVEQRDLAGLMQATPGQVLHYFAFLAIGLLITSVANAAVYRAVLTPEDSRFFYLRLGKDELRQMLLFLAVVAVFTVVLILDLIVASIFAIPIAAKAGQNAFGFVYALALLLVGGSFVYVAVRLTPAGPMTFIKHKVILRDAWMLTRGHFWATFAVRFLTTVFALIVVLLVSAIMVGVMTALSGGDFVAASKAVFYAGSVTEMTNGRLIEVFQVVTVTVLGVLLNTVLQAPTAAVYRALAPRGENESPGVEANMI